MGAVVSLRNAVLDKILRGTNFTTQATHISLHTADPSTTGANEVSGGSYARKAISFAVASAGESDSDAVVTFAGMPACTVTHVGLWTALSGGTYLWRGVLAVSKTLDAGDTIEFASGAVTVPTTGV
jgi:hypothetical protein